MAPRAHVHCGIKAAGSTIALLHALRDAGTTYLLHPQKCDI
ncbi:hypothetical protein [Desulfovibrio sp. MES5]|nr:hypothetical protein [Desulfovibrio sp. MES5]